MKRLLEAGLLHGEAMTVTGKTLQQNVQEMPTVDDQPVIYSVDTPRSPTGGLAILYGNLAPEGAVIKVAGHQEKAYQGKARVFDQEQDAFQAIQRREIRPGDVVVIRYEGPKGGPGMREMLQVTGALVGQGLGGRSSAIDRRPVFRSDPRAHGWTRGSRGGGWWPNRSLAGGRHNLRWIYLRGAWTLSLPKRNSRTAGQGGSPFHPTTPRACSPNTRNWFLPHRKAL